MHANSNPGQCRSTDKKLSRFASPAAAPPLACRYVTKPVAINLRLRDQARTIHTNALRFAQPAHSPNLPLNPARRNGQPFLYPHTRKPNLQRVDVYTAYKGQKTRWTVAWQDAQKQFPILRYWHIIQRCAITLLLLFIIRSGAFIPLPGVDMQHIPSYMPTTQGERMIRALYGQAMELPSSLFMLGVSPFINSSILFSILLAIPPMPALDLPFLQRLREARKEGKGGEALLNSWINRVALFFAVYQAGIEAHQLSMHVLFPKWFFWQTVLALVAGSCCIHACADGITHAGIGNGTTLVICSSIISGYADILHKLLTALESAAVATWHIAILAIGFLVVLGTVVVMNLTEYRLKIVAYASTVPQDPSKVGSSASVFNQARVLWERRALERSSQGSFLPIQLNASGIMPLIIASAAYYGLLPLILRLVGRLDLVGQVAAAQNSLVGLLLYGVMVFALEFLPFGQIKPGEVAEYFSNISVGIKNWAPGQITEHKLKEVLMQVKFWGGMLLAFVAVAAHWLDMLSASWIGAPLGTTNLLILVGFVLQTFRQLTSLAEGPRLQQQLDKERSLIENLSGT